jgi:hypothetical protein
MAILIVVCAIPAKQMSASFFSGLFKRSPGEGPDEKIARLHSARTLGDGAMLLCSQSQTLKMQGVKVANLFEMMLLLHCPPLSVFLTLSLSLPLFFLSFSPSLPVTLSPSPCSVLFCPVTFCSGLFCSVLFYSVLFCPVLFC